MEIYSNFSGESNVSLYEIGDDHIIVKFKNRSKDGRDTYKYSYSSTGQKNVDHMKLLAISGTGLNTFINKKVKKFYENKW